MLKSAAPLHQGGIWWRETFYSLERLRERSRPERGSCSRRRDQESPQLPDSPSSDWVLDSETHYIYDGLRVIQERNGTNNTPTVSYTRGNDLSGALEASAD